MKPLDHELFDQTMEKFVKQLPSRDATINISIQVDSDEYIKHVPSLPLILDKDHCVRKGSKWVHNQLKPLPKVEMSADRGAQVGTTGPQHLKKWVYVNRTCSEALSACIVPMTRRLTTSGCSWPRSLGNPGTMGRKGLSTR